MKFRTLFSIVMVSLIAATLLASHIIETNYDDLEMNDFKFFIKGCGYSIDGCYTPLSSMYIYTNLGRISFRLSVIFVIALIIQTSFSIILTINFLVSIIKTTLFLKNLIVKINNFRNYYSFF